MSLLVPDPTAAGAHVGAAADDAALTELRVLAMTADMVTAVGVALDSTS